MRVSSLSICLLSVPSFSNANVPFLHLLQAVETSDLLIFSGGIEMEQWREMGLGV